MEKPNADFEGAMRAAKHLEVDLDAEVCRLSVDLQNALGLQSVICCWDNFLQRVYPADRETLRETIDALQSAPNPTNAQVRWLVLRLHRIVPENHDNGSMSDPQAYAVRARVSGLQAIVELLDSDELNGVLSDLQDENNRIRNQIAIAAHDLREPMRTMGRFAEALDATPDEADQQIFRHEIREAAGRMRRLIDGILDHAGDGGAEPPEPIDLETVLQEVGRNLDDQIRRTHAKIIVHGLPTILGQFQPCVRLFQNLISNALKFSQEETRPVVELSAGSEDDVCVVEVQDNGRGIEPNMLPRVLDAFQSAGEERGAGLGLSICQRVMEDLAGSIDIKSEVGQGTTIRLTFPARICVQRPQP